MVWSDTYVSYFYPNVAVFDKSSSVTTKEGSTLLQQLAEETDSFIAIQHQEVGTDGTPVFSYTTFGQGELPKGLLAKTFDEVGSINLEANYFIFDGKLEVDLLKQELNRIGLKNLYATTPSYLTVLVPLVSNGFQIISLLIFYLTFGSLNLIGQLLEMIIVSVGVSRTLIYSEAGRQRS